MEDIKKDTVEILTDSKKKAIEINNMSKILNELRRRNNNYEKELKPYS